MSIEENKALARSWFDFPGPEDWLQGKPGGNKQEAPLNERLKSAMSEIFSPDWVAHAAQGDIGFDGYVGMTAGLIGAFPDLSFSIKDIIAEEDKVAVSYVMRGTNQGSYQGMPATGKKVEVSGVSIGRISDGKFVEGWAQTDSLGMMQQLGLVPPK